MTSSYDELAVLTCRNNHTSQPVLMSSSDQHTIGAYCRACRIWIKWVPRTQVWLTLLESQKLSSQVSAAPAPATDPLPELPELPLALQLHIAEDIANIAQLCYDQSGAMGFHDGMSRTVGERAMLVVTELAELFEAYRKNKYFEPSDHISDFSYAAEEWADCLIRIFDHALDDVSADTLGKAVAAKIAFNRTRGFRHGGKRV